MSLDLYTFVRPFLQKLDAEQAHRLTIRALALGGSVQKRRPDDSRLAVKVLGSALSNPIGMAAGFDKNAEVPAQLVALGFGFAEVGTITPLAQAGNPRPRLFRLTEDEAVINRMGFNNDGHQPALARIAAAQKDLFLGVNIGANKDSSDRIGDYVLGVERFAPVAKYLTVNISSPNTPGLRDLQTGTALQELLSRVLAARSKAEDKLGRRVPILVKVSPDLADEDLDDVTKACLAAEVEGMIVSNTTITRPPLKSPAARETGGLSGAPLFRRSTRALARVYRITQGQILLVGVGGVSSVETAIEKFRAGASLIQLYTALTYRGPRLIQEIKAGLCAHMDREGLAHVGEITGTGAEEWAKVQID
jgi:dihydroorotate dehydrogenase